MVVRSGVNKTFIYKMARMDRTTPPRLSNPTSLPTAIHASNRALPRARYHILGNVVGAAYVVRQVTTQPTTAVVWSGIGALGVAVKGRASKAIFIAAVCKSCRVRTRVVPLPESVIDLTVCHIGSSSCGISYLYA